MEYFSFNICRTDIKLKKKCKTVLNHSYVQNANIGRWSCEFANDRIGSKFIKKNKKNIAFDFIP